MRRACRDAGVEQKSRCPPDFSPVGCELWAVGRGRRRRIAGRQLILAVQPVLCCTGRPPVSAVGAVALPGHPPTIRPLRPRMSLSTPPPSSLFTIQWPPRRHSFTLLHLPPGHTVFRALVSACQQPVAATPLYSPFTQLL